MRATGSCMITQVHRFLCTDRKTCIHTLARRRQVSDLNSLSAAVRAAEDMAGAILHACRSLLANGSLVHGACCSLLAATILGCSLPAGHGTAEHGSPAVPARHTAAWIPPVLSAGYMGGTLLCQAA